MLPNSVPQSRGFKVYLAGPISGLTYDGAQDWRAGVKDTIEQASAGLIRCYSPLREKGYLRENGVLVDSYEDKPLSSERGIMTRDRFDCMSADLILVNLLGAKAVSQGTVMEIAWADMLRKPVVAAMEPTGNPHDHPMVRQAIGFRVGTLFEAADLVCKVLLP